MELQTDQPSTECREKALKMLDQISRKSAVSLASLGEEERWLMLSLAALSLSTGQEYSEKEVNEALLAWLQAGEGMLRIDHVELRRVLIDFGLWRRRDGGRAYSLNCPQTDDRFATIIAAFGEDDGKALISQRRTSALQARAARRAARLAL